MKWARVENGVVQEITDTDPKGRFVKEIEDQFISCSDDVEQGYAYTNNTFSAPVGHVPTTEEKIADLDTEYQAQFSSLAQALGLATLDGNQANIDSIKADYTALKAEYQTKKEAIVNG